MRYFVVEYLQQPDGRYNERAGVHKSIKPNLLTKAMAILDFQERKITKLRVDAGKGPRDFDKVSAFFKNNGYGEVIGKIEAKYELMDAAVAAVKQSAEETHTN